MHPGLPLFTVFLVTLALGFAMGWFWRSLRIPIPRVTNPERDRVERRRKRHLEQEYDELQNGHSRDECPLADE